MSPRLIKYLNKMIKRKSKDINKYGFSNMVSHDIIWNIIAGTAVGSLLGMVMKDD